MSSSHCATRASLASFLAAALALSRLMMQELGDFAYLALHASMLNGSIACADREVPAIRAAAAEAAAAFRTDGRRSAALGAIADRKRATSNRPIDACVEGAASGAFCGVAEMVEDFGCTSFETAVSLQAFRQRIRYSTLPYCTQ